MVHVGGTRWVAHTWGSAVGAGLAMTSLGGAIGLMPGTACGTGHWPFYVGPRASLNCWWAALCRGRPINLFE
jgi:hypothetical protein